MLQNPELAEYRWIITKDHTEVLGIQEPGETGPYNLDPDLTTNASTFALYDDDNNLYYEGMIYGDYDGFEPLDDYGTPNAGCTKMKLDGEWL